MTVLITRKQWEALPEGAPYELHDGMLVRQPSPRFGHQRIQARLFARLAALLGTEGRVVAGPVDILVDEITVFVPDLVVLDEVPDDDAQYAGVPAAVFEILSPSTAARDRGFKTRRLLGFGVREVWLIDPRGHDPRGPSVHCMTVDGERAADDEGRVRSLAVDGFDLAPGDLAVG